MQRGTQIAYVPSHVDRSDPQFLNDSAVEFGFVTSIEGDVAWCRYWFRGKPGFMRTTSCSEITSLCDLIEHRSVDQLIIIDWFQQQEDEKRLERQVDRMLELVVSKLRTGLD